jgi:hypothetical protein
VFAGGMGGRRHRDWLRNEVHSGEEETTEKLRILEKTISNLCDSPNFNSVVLCDILIPV